MSNLALYDYGNPEVEAFLQETLEREEEPAPILRSLARRESSRDLMAERLRSGGLERSERLVILETLFESGDMESRDMAWKALEAAEQEVQDELLGGLASTEPRAMDLVLRRMESDAVSSELGGGIGRLDAKVVHLHREALTRIAGNPGLSGRTRSAAATALAKVDAGAAATQVMIGFEGADATTRLGIVRTLREGIGGEEAKAFLGSIAAGDPSGEVRSAAAE
jgi:hypothetical protein